MGLAASQARLLQLTSMLSDVEFEGQQINNARTKLSSTSAQFYAQLLDLDVPTPPSKSDFTNLEYTYNQNGNEYKITDMGVADANGNTQVGVQSKQQGTVMKPSATEKGTVTQEKAWVVDEKNAGNGYVQGDQRAEGQNYTPVKAATEYDPNATYVDGEGNSLAQQIQDAVNQKAASGDYITGDKSGIATGYSEGLCKKGDEYMEKYTVQEQTGTDEDGNPIYETVEKERSYDPPRYNSAGEVDVAKEFADCIPFGAYQEVAEGEEEGFIGPKTVEATKTFVNGKETQSLSSEELDGNEQVEAIRKTITDSGRNPEEFEIIINNGSYEIYEKADINDGDGEAAKWTTQTGEVLVDGTKNAQLEFGKDGRVSAINIDGQRLAVTPKSSTDEAAYEDAYAAYTYEKQMYDKDQAAINSQLSNIQQQDKRLELQLSELDTRRTEITTELEALQTVMKDNIERTFKSFSG